MELKLSQFQIISYQKNTNLDVTGEYDINVFDLAGNYISKRVAINSKNKVCINNQILQVKAQYMFKADNIILDGRNGYEFTKNDIVIYAIPLYDGGVVGGCDSNS